MNGIANILPHKSPVWLHFGRETGGAAERQGVLAETTSIALPARPFPPWRSAGVAVAAFIAQVFALVAALFGYGIFYGIAHARSGIDQRALMKTLRDVASVPVQTAEIIAYLAMLAVLLWLLPKVALRSVAALGLSRDQLAQWRPLAIGVALGFGIEIAGTLYVLAIHQEHHQQAGFEHFAPVTPLASLLVIVVGIVLAPITEELLFRALIFGALAERLPVVVAALISGAIFGAIHGDLILFPVLMTLGVAGALLYARTGNLWSAIALHVTNNTIGFGLMFYGLKHHSH